jgi:hypothetical protein
MIDNPQKLIKVALPLPEINDASAYDKMPGIAPHSKVTWSHYGIGEPHLWGG